MREGDILFSDEMIQTLQEEHPLLPDLLCAVEYYQATNTMLSRLTQLWHDAVKNGQSMNLKEDFDEKTGVSCLFEIHPKKATHDVAIESSLLAGEHGGTEGNVPSGD